MDRNKIFSARRSDFIVKTFCSGGPGGQHQNKVATGVRITYKPNGWSEESRVHKSQLQNRKNAFRKIAGRLVEHYVNAERRERYSAGHEVVRTYNEPGDRVVDHTTGATYSYKHTVGKGDLSEVIEDRCLEMGAVNT